MTLSIHSLEKRLGISLFERHVDGMRLIEYGECIVPRTSRAMDAFFAHIGITVPSPVIETGDLAILRGVLLRSDMLAAKQLERFIACMALTSLQTWQPFVCKTTRPFLTAESSGEILDAKFI